jgi:hypothetical protein
MVVGDDVAARVHDEAGAEGLAHAEALVFAVISALAALAAEEAVEEVLHVALVALVSLIAAEGDDLAAAAGAPVGGLLGNRLGVDVDHRGANVLGDPGEGGGEIARIGNGERTRVGGVDCLALGADRAGEDGANENAKGEDRQQREGRAQTVIAKASEEVVCGLLLCVHR